MRRLLPSRIAELSSARFPSCQSQSRFFRFSSSSRCAIATTTTHTKYHRLRLWSNLSLTRQFTQEPRLSQQATSITMNKLSPTSRSKRKAPFSPDERPHKHFRPTNGKISPGENTPDAELANFVDSEMATDEEPGPLYPPQAPPDTVEWQATIENVVRNVVSIRFCQTCSFDTDSACASEATGFVVDAEKG